MSKLQLLLLGHFECLLPSGERVSLSMRKAEVLLAFLALAPGIRHPRERLINLLWSDRGDEQARNSLRQCLSTIRKALGDSAELALQIDRSSVCLKPETLDVDAHEFERLADDPDNDSLATAAELYRGEFLEGISIRDAASQEWLDSERARFRRQYIEILGRLGQAQLAASDFTRAIRSGERLTEQDALIESGWRLLMRACHANGNRNQALQAFKRCQQVLHNELGVDPEAETIALRDSIASGESLQASAQPAPAGVAAPAVGPAKSGDHSIAVLPFDNLSGDPAQEYFSDGITESIILNLALFPGLHVKSRHSSFAFKQQLKGLAEISRELEVDYLVEGSIRKSSERIRITVQLIDAASGNQVWGKRYDASLDKLFDVEEELSRTLAATLTVQIESDLQRIAIGKPAADQRAYDLLLAGMYYCYRFNPTDNVIAIEKFEHCLAQEPGNVRAHVGLYICHIMACCGRWVEDIDRSRRKAKEYIHRAIELDPEDPVALLFLAEYSTFAGNPGKARPILQQLLEKNPSDPEILAVMALVQEVDGDPEAALQTAKQVLSLDPYHPWVEWELVVSNYLCGHFEEAIELIGSMRSLPGFIKVFAVVSAVKLGRLEQARAHLQEFLEECQDGMETLPQTLDEWLEYTRANYPFTDARINQDLVDCLVEAGLEDTLKSPVRDHPSIAILPLENLGSDPEQEYFSDGITESIIMNLALFRELNVKSRHASFAFRNSARTVAEIARELDVQYFVEGSIRKQGERLRITVQLVETGSGNHVWGQRYDTVLEDLFTLEQELVQNIAAAISARIDQRIKQVSALKPANSLESYDYLMRGWYHAERFTPEDYATAIDCMQRCLAIDPGNAHAHTILGATINVQVFENWTAERETVHRDADYHLGEALNLDQHDALAHAYMAEHQILRHDFKKALFHANKAIEHNPALPDGYNQKALVLSSQREHVEAVKLAEQSLQSDPYHFYMAWNAGIVFREAGEFGKAVDTFRLLPHPPGSVRAELAAALVGVGEIEEAREEMTRYLERAHREMSSMPNSIDAWRNYWSHISAYQFDDDFDAFFDLLLQAGLCKDLADSTEEMPSIAVLPFNNMSADPEQAFFSDGITADIVSILSRFRHLRTVARHSTEIYRERKASIAEIAAEQRVRYILEGNVRKSGNRIRVSAELIDASNEQICWSERYDRDLDDLFAVQDEITREITLAMKVHLDDGEMARHRSVGSTDLRAWELTLAAADLQDTYVHQNILESRSMVKKALELDPGYGYAHVILGWTYWQEVYSGWSADPEQSLANAEACNQRALQLNPDHADALAQSATCSIMRHDAKKALEHGRRAVELEPSSSDNQALLAFTCVFDGDFQSARVHDQQMRRLSPIMPNWYHLPRGQIEIQEGALDQAIATFSEGVNTEPESPLCRFYLVHACVEKGDLGAARNYADEIKRLDSTIDGSGLVRAYSKDSQERDRFRQSLAQFDLV